MNADLPETLTLYPSKLKWSLVLLASLAFVAIGVFLVSGNDPVIGWACIGFFGLGIPLALLQMFGGKSWLKLDEHGFEYSQFGKKYGFSWQEVSEFGVWKMKQGFLTTSQHVGFSTQEQASGMLGKMSHALVGATGSLPDTYGMSAKDLARTMNAFRDRSLRN